MSGGKKSGKKGHSEGNPNGSKNGNRSGSMGDQLESLLGRDPRFERVFGSEENFSVDGEGNFSQGSRRLQRREFKHAPGSWYKDNAENQSSAESSPGRFRQVHHQRFKERNNMNTGEGTAGSSGMDAAFKATAEKIGEGAATKNAAAEEALRQGFEMGRQAQAGQQTKDAAKDVAKSWWTKTKDAIADKKTAIGVMLGVAGCVGVTAGVKAYKERQGQRSARVGDTTVTWGDGNMAGAGAGGGGGGGAPAGNNNAAGNRGGGR